jgi:hypothetical protein
LAGLPGLGLDHNFHHASGRYAEQSKAKKTAEFSYTRIAQTFAPCRADRKPDLITRGGAIYGLQQKLKTKGQL